MTKERRTAPLRIAPEMLDVIRQTQLEFMQASGVVISVPQATKILAGKLREKVPRRSLPYQP